MNATPTTSLRAALQLALAVARQGEQEWPAVPAPARLRPYLGFAKAPNAALELCRRVVDEDEAFRRRVAAEATVDQVGSVGWLWLTRPDNWEAGVAELQAQAERVRAEHGTARHRDELARRQAAVRETLEQANQARRRLAADLDQLRAEHTEQQRQAREQRSAREAAEAELARVEAERVSLLRRLKAAEALVARHGADLRALRTEHDTLRRAHTALGEELAELRAAGEPVGAPPDGEVPATASAPADGRDPGRPATDAAPGEVVPPALRAAVEAASRAAAALSDALGAAAAALDQPGRDPSAQHRADHQRDHRADHHGDHRVAQHRGADGEVDRRSGVPAGPARGRGGETAIRRPLRMPPGTFEDTAEAAEYLVRVPRVLFLVDGYNVAKAGWPELELRHQRDRLVEALVALQARTGAQTDVVFDGVDDGRLQARIGPGRLRVEFTPSHIEADDRLLELVELLPVARPVVVVSNDRRVRDGARRRGANTLRSEQLLWLLR